jgi:hypothetical protein
MMICNPNWAHDPSLGFFQQLRQLGDIGRNPPRLIFDEQLGGRASARFILTLRQKMSPALT